jgi:RES domain-containing protein
MQFWRICRRRYAAEAVRVVYASTSLSLAAVETFVNMEPNLRPADLVSIEGAIPDAMQTVTLDVKALPARWYETRDESLHRFGDEWIREGRSATLLVPSAAIRGEWNVLMNPAHAEFSKIEFRNPEPFEFDARMFR